MARIHQPRNEGIAGVVPGGLCCLHSWLHSCVVLRTGVAAALNIPQLSRFRQPVGAGRFIKRASFMSIRPIPMDGTAWSARQQLLCMRNSSQDVRLMHITDEAVRAWRIGMGSSSVCIDCWRVLTSVPPIAASWWCCCVRSSLSLERLGGTCMR